MEQQENSQNQYDTKGYIKGSLASAVLNNSNVIGQVLGAHISKPIYDSNNIEKGSITHNLENIEYQLKAMMNNIEVLSGKIQPILTNIELSGNKDSYLLESGSDLASRLLDIHHKIVNHNMSINNLLQRVDL